MSFLYPLTSDAQFTLNTGSYLSKKDVDLFYNGTTPNIWYGTSNKDAIEVSVYDLDENLIHWTSIDNVGHNKPSSLTYIDPKNNAISYAYDQFIFDKPMFKTGKVLVDPISDIFTSSLEDTSYIISYQFPRYMAGSPTNPLIIKDISPSKTELKLIPSVNSDPDYDGFCVGKTQLHNISPLYITLTTNCSYGDLYRQTRENNEAAVAMIKRLFFIASDGKFVEFLKSLYEDFIKYSATDDNQRASAILRIQGIRTYFSNFLVSHTDDLVTFDEIKLEFEVIVKQRLDVLFVNYKSEQYLLAKQYLYDLFVSYYFKPIHSTLQLGFENKYTAPLKNALCYGVGQYIPILNTSFLDERAVATDPLTLLVKLQTPLVNKLSIKSAVWVSNIGMVPILFNTVFKKNVIDRSIKISNPNFSIAPVDASFAKSNTYYTAQDLDGETAGSANINISKKISELNVDYSSFSNFIVFSSAELRHNIFKNKMISLSGITSELESIETAYSSSGYTYQYYTTEKQTLEDKQSEVLNSFDGYESYLYKTGYYDYSLTIQLFSSSSFVDVIDDSARSYDKNNRDSLTNNTPEHIVVDAENDDYLIFLSMVGHYFDNLYLYIKSLPSQKVIEDNNTFSRSVLQQMLQSLGWSIDTALEGAGLSNNSLDSKLNGLYETSADDRTRQIWNRILNTLPIIYKTKGTEECIKLILACYGVPSTLIKLKEYGGIDYSTSDKTSYTIEEKIFMLSFVGNREYLSIPFDPSIKTVEFKVSLDPTLDYTPLTKIPLATKYNQYNEIDWTVGVYKEPAKHVGRAYFELAYPSYTIGLIGDYGRVNAPATQSFAVAQALVNKNPDIIITTGDNTYETGLNAFDNTVGRLYSSFINPYVGVSGSGAIIPRFFPTIGNHDYIDSSFDLYQAFFPTTPRFYTFTKGNVQFFMLNSDSHESSGSTVTSDQADWFTTQLSGSYNNPDILWRLAVFHHCYISSGSPPHLAPWMDWSWDSLGIDAVLVGHDHFYERLEDGIPVIVQGGSGTYISDFSNIVAESRFRWNTMQGYTIIESRGNKLTFTLYDMNGEKVPDTGDVTLPSCSVDNGNFIMGKSIVPFSDRPFRQSDKYILSDPIPIFNGEIFNVMLRKNTPDVKFEYNLVSDTTPTQYDLRVQRRTDGRTIFNALSSDILTQTYNYKFSNAGVLYFGNYQQSSSFIGLLDKLLIWDSPITDATYNDHCNNLNSYSYTGSSIPYDTLYFRMNFDYPVDLALATPSKIINANEQYSSSIWMEAYNFSTPAFSASIDDCLVVSHSVYPYQFSEIPYNQTFTIKSYGPNKFKNQKIQKKELTLACRLDPNDRSTYNNNQFISPDSNQVGLFADPNSYKNKDIFRYLGDYGVTGLLASPLQMFDDKYYPLQNVRESYHASGNKRVLYNEMFTLYKFYFDKSIFETIKQVIPARNNILSGILIEPTVLERPKYQYRRIVSNACNLETTSSNTLTYSTSSLDGLSSTLSMNNTIAATKPVVVDLISIDFKLDLDIFTSQMYENLPFYIPVGPYQPTDPVYVDYLELVDRLTWVDSGWIKKFPPATEVGVIEQHPTWVKPVTDTGTGGSTPTINIISFGDDFTINAHDGFYYTGSGYYYLKNCYFYTTTNERKINAIDYIQRNLVAPIDLSIASRPTVNYQPSLNTNIIYDIENPDELGSHCDDTGKIIETALSGSTPTYLIKNWTKQELFTTVGDYAKPQLFESHSLYTYTTKTVTAPLYQSMVYTSSIDIFVSDTEIAAAGEYIPDYSPNQTLTVDGWIFHHDKLTFNQRPNSGLNNIFMGFGSETPTVIDTETYFEAISGYPRNHLTHKRVFFSSEAKPVTNTYTTVKTEIPESNPVEYTTNVVTTYSRYVKSRQTINTTVNIGGLNDNTLPVQTINVSNINVVKKDNILK